MAAAGGQTLECKEAGSALLSLRGYYEDNVAQTKAQRDAQGLTPAQTQMLIPPILTELEMRIYHRLLYLRAPPNEQELIPGWVNKQRPFMLATKFRDQVQYATTDGHSRPLTKYLELRVSDDAMQTFAELVQSLHAGDGQGGAWNGHDINGVVLPCAGGEDWKELRDLRGWEDGSYDRAGPGRARGERGSGQLLSGCTHQRAQDRQWVCFPFVLSVFLSHLISLVVHCDLDPACFLARLWRTVACCASTGC